MKACKYWSMNRHKLFVRYLMFGNLMIYKQLGLDNGIMIYSFAIVAFMFAIRALCTMVGQGSIMDSCVRLTLNILAH